MFQVLGDGYRVARIPAADLLFGAMQHLARLRFCIVGIEVPASDDTCVRVRKTNTPSNARTEANTVVLWTNLIQKAKD